jgi:hypothetical protein
VRRRAGRDAGGQAVPLLDAASAPGRRSVAFLALPNTALLELAGTLHVFCEAENGAGLSAYVTILLSTEGGRIPDGPHIPLETQSLSAVCLSSIDTLLLVGIMALRNTRPIRVCSPGCEAPHRGCAVSAPSAPPLWRLPAQECLRGGARPLTGAYTTASLVPFPASALIQTPSSCETIRSGRQRA